MLGDGRAILLGEHVSQSNKKYDIQFKGSGKTAFSRNGDGRAALGPMLREYIISEAMNALKIPTTRSLAVVKTGELIQREKALQGAILTRVASSHIRVGTFQYIAARQKDDELKTLLDYTIDRHYPEIKNSNNQALDLLNRLIERQCDLVVNWMRVGFIHGVMNTDNMTISGETIDYGPCAFMDRYDPNTFFSSIDTQGRYAYSNQPLILSWNLARFAETLIPLIDKDQDKAIELLSEKIISIKSSYEQEWLKIMAKKIGITVIKNNDLKLLNNLLDIMNDNDTDFTLTFRYLSELIIGDENLFYNLFKSKEKINKWVIKWKGRIKEDSKLDESFSLKLNKNNPLYIPRNHIVEDVLSKALFEKNFQPFHEFYDILVNPYNEKPNSEKYTLPAPITNQPYKTFCGT